MISAVDTETYEFKKRKLKPVLNTKKFILGKYLDERGDNKYFNTKDEMWEYIINKGRKLKKNNEVLNVYAHNHMYDFLAYADFTNENLIYYSDSPFIVTYRENDRDVVKFLDTYALQRSSLSSIGDILNFEKFEMPKEIESRDDLKQYITRDTEIVLKFVLYFKKKLLDENIRLQRLYTINQVAIQYMLSKLKDKPRPYFFFNKDRNQLHFTKRESRIHDAYRGARVECFQTGNIENVSHIDVNSLYPYSAMKMNFPDLRTQEFLEYPDKATIYNKDIGVARCLIKNVSDPYGLLQIRTPSFSFCPKPGKMFIGTYTIDELKAIKGNGYHIKDIQWLLTYDNAEENPYHELVPTIYNKKMEADNDFDRYFYKSMLNNHLGKFAQTRINQEMQITDIDAAIQLEKKGYQLLYGIDNTRYEIVKKNVISKRNKSYYCPIIPTMVNAIARIEMWEHFRKIPLKDLVYTDTDSIMFQGNHLNKFLIDDSIGNFKLLDKHKEALIWGRKTYMIGNNIKASGIHKSNLSYGGFEKGYLEHSQMQTLKTSTNISEIGTFKTVKRDFTEQLYNYKKSMDFLEKMDVYIDYNIENIDYFYKTLESLSGTPKK